MGCDIHLVVERKLPDGSWEEVQPPYVIKAQAWRAGQRTWDPTKESGDYQDPRPDPTTRHYYVFAFLADVRNAWHRELKPQFPYRGFPKDSIYDERGPDIDGYPWLGDHSFTWATLRELLDAPWTSDPILRKSQFHRWIHWLHDEYLAGEDPENVRVLMGFDS